MDTVTLDTAEHVVILAGELGPADLPELRDGLVAASERTPRGADLLLDARDVTAFDDGCLPALVAARSRAKWHKQTRAVLAGVGSPLEASLRRTGRLGRIQVFEDAETAHRTLALDRAGRSFLVGPTPEQRTG